MPYGIYPRNRHRNRPTSKSGMKGVYRHRYCTSHPWKAYIRHHGWYICLGYFATKLEAAMAYNRKALQLYGPDTYFNPLIPD